MFSFLSLGVFIVVVFFRDGKLNKTEFNYMLKHLFCRKGVPYKLTAKDEEAMFKLLDDTQVRFSVDQITTSWYQYNNRFSSD